MLPIIIAGVLGYGVGYGLGKVFEDGGEVDQEPDELKLEQQRNELKHLRGEYKGKEIYWYHPFHAYLKNNTITIYFQKYDSEKKHYIYEKIKEVESEKEAKFVINNLKKGYDYGKEYLEGSKVIVNGDYFYIKLKNSAIIIRLGKKENLSLKMYNLILEGSKYSDYDKFNDGGKIIIPEHNELNEYKTVYAVVTDKKGRNLDNFEKSFNNHSTDGTYLYFNGENRFHVSYYAGKLSEKYQKDILEHLLGDLEYHFVDNDNEEVKIKEIEKEYQIMNKESEKYYSISISDGKIKWNSSPDMGYKFTMEEANKIKESLQEKGYNQLEIIKYDSDWWKKV